MSDQEPAAWVDPLDLAEKQQSFMACSDQYERTHSNLRFKVPLYLAAPVAQPSPQPLDPGDALYGKAWEAIGRYSSSICRPDAELAPPDYLLEAMRALAARSLPPSGEQK